MADMVLAGVASLTQTTDGYAVVTASELLDEAMQLMGEPTSSRQTYEYSLVSTVNRLMTELFDANNSCREKNGKEPFTEYPQLVSISETVPYEYEMISNVMVYGLAYWLFLQDEEYVKANAMKAQYMDGLNKNNYAKYQDVGSIV